MWLGSLFLTASLWCSKPLSTGDLALSPIYLDWLPCWVHLVHISEYTMILLKHVPTALLSPLVQVEHLGQRQYLCSQELLLVSNAGNWATACSIRRILCFHWQASSLSFSFSMLRSLPPNRTKIGKVSDDEAVSIIFSWCHFNNA